MQKKIKWGAGVVTTELAIEKHIFSQHRKGICLGSARSRLSIVVVCAGQVTPSMYHHSFWKKSS